MENIFEQLPKEGDIALVRQNGVWRAFMSEDAQPSFFDTDGDICARGATVEEALQALLKLI